ncbi:MAG: hypothetical protein KF859_06020 [Phycisphaeraceae bacterium]|nr:hypothetical protein [Phycisphaeraceae bacterium]
MTSHHDTLSFTALVVSGVLACVQHACAQTLLYESNFSDGLDGWTVQEYNGYCPIGSFVRHVTNISHETTGGMTGPFMRAIEPAIGDGAYFKAPPGLVMMLPDAAGGWLTFERRTQVLTGSPFGTPQDEVTIIGNGTTLVATTAFPPLGAWRNRMVPMVHTAWRVGSCAGPISTPAQFHGALSSASELFIKCEQVLGQEINDLDSVRLYGPPSDGCGFGWQWVDNDHPAGRWGHAVALDTHRNVIVLYGGFTGERDTWEYTPTQDGVGTWRRTATEGPGPKANHAMVYDGARGRVVLLGGAYAPIANFPEYLTSADVWEYQSDGIVGTWTRSPDSLPQPRESLKAVYDEQRNTIVAYGGRASGTGATDVLERGSGSTQWVSVPTTINPGPRLDHAIAYDSARGKVVLVAPGETHMAAYQWNPLANPPEWEQFDASSPPQSRGRVGLAFDTSGGRNVFIMCGGEFGGTNYSGTFELNPAASGGPAWRPRAGITAAGGSAARTRHAVSWDPVANQVLLFGGLSGDVNPQRQVLGYSSSANRWTDRWNTNTPTPREFAGAAFDHSAGRVIIAGGGIVTRPGASPARQIARAPFAWDGTAWSRLPDSPNSFWKAPMVYVPTTNPASIFVYGGERGGVLNSNVSNQVWRLDLGPVPAWTTVNPSPAGRRAQHAAAYHAGIGRIVFFGGRNENTTLLNSTWTLDPLTEDWTQVFSTTSPSPRTGASMAYDERRGIVVLFGGQTSPGVYDDSTWEFDGSQWINVSPSDGGPAPRASASMVYVNSRGTLVLSGGDGSNATNSQGLDDVWEFDGRTWRRLLPTIGEHMIGKSYASLVYDPVRDRLVRFGGTAIAFAQSGTSYHWYLSSQTWTLDLPPVPVLHGHPAGSSACPGDEVEFVVVPASAQGCTFEWRFNGAPIDINLNPTASESRLVIASAQPHDSGVYECLVTNPCGSALSASAELNVAECCSPADFNQDGGIDGADVEAFFDAWGEGDLSADVNQDGGVDGADVATFFDAWENGGCG